MKKKLIKFFSSLKLTIFILIVLAFTSIIGTFIQQRQNPLLYEQQYGNFFSQIFKALGFFDLYHSWWFILLLLILALNLLFCSLKRLPIDWKIISQPKVKLETNQIQAYTSKEKISINNTSIDQLLETIQSRMRKGGFPCKKKLQDENGWYLFSEKGKFGRLAFYITHISIILIFIGAIIGAAKGFKGFVNIPEGEKISSIVLTSHDGRSKTKNLNFEVECKKFELTYYKDKEGNITNRPKDYKSQLVIYEQGQEVLAKEIEVNSPLNYKGIYFYQSSYGEIPTLKITVKSSEGEIVDHFEVGERESFQFTGENNEKIDVKVLQYLPDFTMNQNRQPISRSNMPNNPAAMLEITQENSPPSRTWIFQRFPDFAHKKITEYTFSLNSVNSFKKYTGLQVVWDPGVPVVWAGCIILILGIIVIFTVPHQRLWILINSQQNKHIVNIIGTTNKNKPTFQKTFSNFITSCKHNLADTKK